MARVLVVDDDSGIARMLEDFLSSTGFEVDLAKDLHRGLDMARQRRPDVALVDLWMPEDGVTLCDQLRALYDGHVPVILLTAAGNPEGAAKQVQATDYLAKPFELDDLLQRVEKVLSSGAGRGA